MRVSLTFLVLLLFLCAGCEKEMDLADRLPRSSIELTDGYCLVAGDQVVVNHYDISYYDYGAHLIYLKSHRSSAEFLEEAGSLTVYAGGEEIYTVGTHPGYSSYMPTEPFIWTFPTFYEDYIIAIDLMLATYEAITMEVNDIREDQRIVEALKKYGQYREGLHCEISSCNYSAPGEVVLKLKLTNRDEVNYYYPDPEKMGMGLFHYYTNGLSLWDAEEGQSYTNQTEHLSPDPWDSWDMDWLSLLEGGRSVTITLEYKNFDSVPSGSYWALFEFPGLAHVERDQLAQRHGQIWLGKLELKSEVVIQ
jgi:hypothetical protein